MKTILHVSAICQSAVFGLFLILSAGGCTAIYSFDHSETESGTYISMATFKELQCRVAQGKLTADCLTRRLGMPQESIVLDGGRNEIWKYEGTCSIHSDSNLFLLTSIRHDERLRPSFVMVTVSNCPNANVTKLERCDGLP